MKRIISIFVLVVILSGCTSETIKEYNQELTDMGYYCSSLKDIGLDQEGKGCYLNQDYDYTKIFFPNTDQMMNADNLIIFNDDSIAASEFTLENYGVNTFDMVSQFDENGNYSEKCTLTTADGEEQDKDCKQWLTGEVYFVLYQHPNNIGAYGAFADYYKWLDSKYPDAGVLANHPTEADIQKSVKESQDNTESELADVTEYTYQDSTYKVGTDMKPGDYYIGLVPGNDSGYYGVCNDANCDDISFNGNITNNGYITVAEGQYVELSGSGAIPIKDVKPYKAADGLYPTGFYRVGTDIPAGEYKVTTDSGEDSGYYSVSPDMTYQDIVTNDILDAGASGYVTVEEGQILELDGASIQV